MLGNPSLDLGTLELTEVNSSRTVTEGFLASSSSSIGDGRWKSSHDVVLGLNEVLFQRLNTDNTQSTSQNQLQISDFYAFQSEQRGGRKRNRR